MFHKVVLAMVAVVGCGILVAGPARAETQGAQCLKLEQKLSQCSAKKGEKLSRQAAQQCKSRKRQFEKLCANKPVCGQPPFRCPDGYVCAMVMPQPATYASIAELKSDGAEFLYYGECLEREF